MFSCSLCQNQCDEYVFIQSHCSVCERIRRIISLYNKEKVLETLEHIFLRDAVPINNRTAKIVSEQPRKSVRIADAKIEKPL